MTAAEQPQEKPTVLLIDLSAIFWRAWHSSGNDAVSMAKVRTLEAVAKCIEPGDLVAVCCDSPRNWRKALLPDYKATRPEKDHATVGELQAIKERLRADGRLLWEADGFEADDVIATAVAAARKAGHRVIIASPDKDLLQLVSPDVKVLRIDTWKYMGEAEVQAQFGVSPAQLGDWLALKGDKTDNVQGATGVGDKWATKLLTQFGDLDGIYKAVTENPLSIGAPSIVRGLREFEPARKTSRAVIGLKNDAPIKFEEIYQERKPQQIADGPEPEYEDDEPEAQQQQQQEAAPAPTAAHPEVQKATHLPPPAPEQRALTIVEPYERALEPRSIKGAYDLAKGLYESRLYQRFQNPAAIMAVIIRGREMGLGALTACDSFHVIEGKPAPHAYLIIARAKAHPDCEYFQCTETTAERATWVTKNRHNPRPTTLTYTIEDATAAGMLANPKSNWHKRAPELLRKTGGVQLARIEYPDAALGLYAIEELEGAA